MTSHTNQTKDAKAISSIMFAAIAATGAAAIMLQLGGCTTVSCSESCFHSQNATVRVVVAREGESPEKTEDVTFSSVSEPLPTR